MKYGQLGCKSDICLRNQSLVLRVGCLIRYRRHELLTIPEQLLLDLYLVLCVVFCRSLFVLLSVFFATVLCCLSFDLRSLITPLVSSNSSAYPL